jgi:malonyl-CoA O-methyltransferase
MAGPAAAQFPDGAIPAYPGVDWICSTGQAQYAVIWYKLGERDRAERAVRNLERRQRRSGGFYGSWGPGARYFPGEEISWAVKYFLDAQWWRGQAEPGATG